jgi:hypothetical protein
MSSKRGVLLFACATVTYPCVASAQQFEPTTGPQPAPAPTVSPTLAPTVLPDSYGQLPDPTEIKPGRVSGFMGWAFSMPLGSARDLTANISPLGFELQFSGWITSNISVGVSGEWITYVDERPRDTVTVEDTSITATQYNAMQTTSARLIAHYAFLSSGPVRPYVGPHIGVSWSTFDSEAADLVMSDTQVSVNFGGEAGMEIPFGAYAPVGLVNLRYSVSPAAEFRNSVTNVQALSLLLGIGF